MVRKVNIIGGSAYSTRGGIQAVNRFFVRELSESGKLRAAFFLWDEPKDIKPSVEAVARGFGRDQRKFLGSLVAQSCRHPNDLWLSTHLNYGPLCLLATRFKAHRAGIVLHAVELDEPMTFLRRRALRTVGLVIAVSEYTKRKAVAIGVPERRIQVMHLGVDEPRGNIHVDASGRSAARILFVGRMDEHYKGQQTLLDAVELLRDRIPELRLVFVGGGVSLEWWRSEAIRRGLAEVVEFLGRTSDEELHAQYCRAAIFAMPSENEGFGLVYAEAMAYGLPCIGSDRDAAREVVAHGETGWCVPPGNATALAETLAMVIRDREMRHRMGVAGRARFEQFFSVESYRRRLRKTMENWAAFAG